MNGATGRGPSRPRAPRSGLAGGSLAFPRARAPEVPFSTSGRHKPLGDLGLVSHKAMAAAGRPSYLLDAVRLAVVLCFCVSLVRVAHVSNLHTADEEGRASGKQTDAAALGLAAARRLSGVAGQRNQCIYDRRFYRQ